ncbi:hypothetical protein EWM64_g7210 [Hericium alpestre]|uniref:DNA 3'-5' helicase n=1 Tax=Hericium alpestre TaxID=135208 RepID=A0A4Y9ZTH1_9AGAM|nr:hypothetical protein EWM64_g7210 [Hericium alpestre]
MPSTHYTILPPSVPEDWTSLAGLATLKSLVTSSLPFKPRDFQLYDSACILNGQDLFCISATGNGKSALIYIPALVRPHTITVVVEPTNFLEEAMAENLRAKGLMSVVINRDTLLKATLEGQDLWQEARACKYQIIALSPELLRSPEFSVMISTPYFRALWRVLAIDEAHLTDKWGADFRPLYEDIWSIRPCGPEHLTVVALSASVEPEGQTRHILQHLGFTEGTYHMDQRDCEHRNMDLVFRTV